VFQWFDLPGLQMHAAVDGPEDGPLLLLLHGFPEFWYSWRKQIPVFVQAGYRVVAPDQRGYHLTDKSPPFDIHTLVEDIVHLILACERQKARVVGHDWGAAVAWSLAALHPERVDRLAILNVPHPAVMNRALRGGSLRQMIKSWYIFFFQLPRLPEWLLSAGNYAGLARMLCRSSLPSTFSMQDLAEYRKAWAQPGALRAMIGWYRALFRTGLRKQADLAVKIQTPTLVIWGEKDLALSTALAEESLEWTENGRLVRFPDATHWVHADMPAEVNHLLLEHFA